MMLDYEENDGVEYTTVISDLDSEVESATAITEEEEDDYYDDFWAGEYDEYRDVAALVAPPERINFRKYGRRAGNSSCKVSRVLCDVYSVTCIVSRVTCM